MASLRVTFLTGSLEPDKDGVGDYTRWLAIEAARRDVSPRLLAVADRHIAEPSTAPDRSGFETLRLPASMAWPERRRAAREFIRAADPDWVSVQFVPYSFNRWGVPTAVVRAVPSLMHRARLHVMLHEIWIDGRASAWQRLISAAQRRCVVRLCRHAGAVIHTSNAAYQEALTEHGVAADVLPLYGNLSVSGSDGTLWLERLLSEAGCDALAGRRKEWWLAVMFGTLHPVWPPEPLLPDLLAAADRAGKRLALVSVGRIGAGEALWREMRSRYDDRMCMVRLGEQPAARVSDVLNAADFGIATSTLALIGKSGTAAAMIDHGLPLIVNREEGPWQPGRLDARASGLVIRVGDRFQERLGEVERQAPLWRLPQIADRWCGALRGAMPRVA